MRNSSKLFVLFALANVSVAVCLSLSAHAESRETIDRFPRSSTPIASTAAITNTYFPLSSLVRMEFIERISSETTFISLSIAPTLDTLDGVICCGLQERVMRRGQLIEESVEWFAQDPDGAVWLFGEQHREFRKDNVKIRGSWESGVKGAREGRFLPSRAIMSASFRRSHAIHVSEEMAQVILTRDSVTVPAGHFEKCLRVKEWSMLESGHSISWYAAGVGLVRSESTDGDILECVSISSDKSKADSTMPVGK